MGQPSEKVIAPEVDLAATLPAPHFDEAAAQQARPVVPLSSEAVAADLAHTIPYSARPATLQSRRDVWRLAAVVCLLVAVGATAIGVTAYRRNRATPQPQALLVPASEVSPLVMNWNFRPGPSARPAAAAAPTEATAEAVVPKAAPATTASNTRPAATASAAPAPKTVKRSPATTASAPPQNDASATDSSGRPKPRLVDRYVMPRSRP